MKIINVVAAIIIKDNEILATQRAEGQFKDGWEFPGGKIEENETPEEALKREIYEELDIDIKVGDLFETVEYDYPNFHLSMKCYLCTIKSGEIVLKEHKAIKWLSKTNLHEISWLPADLGIIEKLKHFKT